MITSINAEAGEVIKTGQVIMRVATDEGRDAVFNVPEQLFQNKSESKLRLRLP